ncbi:hypothetical protein Syn6312_2904 [Synechococcus sp. PCC 6312]|nr:hypothetical protein Syn6312_2904 [Synechococcus sp. PCC 6312]
MFNRIFVLTALLSLLPTAVFAAPTKFTNPTTNRAEVNITGFTAGQEVPIEFQSVTKSVKASCLIGSDRYALVSSDVAAEINQPFEAFATAGGTPAIKVNGGENIWGSEEGMTNGRCAFVNGTRVFVAPNAQGQAVPVTGNYGPLFVTSTVNAEGNVTGKSSLWVRVPTWDAVPVQIVGGNTQKKYKANSCGIVRFAETETAPLAPTFKVGSTIYTVANLSTAYPPKCYKTGETSYTLFVPAQ